MHCASCANTIARTLKKAPGVVGADVNYATEQLRLEYDPALAALPDLSKKIEPLGYSFLDIGPHNSHIMPDGFVMSGMDHSQHLGLNQTQSEKFKELREYRIKLMVVLPIAAMVFLSMLWELAASFVHLPMLDLNLEIYNKILLIASAVVLFWAGRPFLKGLWNFIRRGAANMDTLVGLGTFAAFIYSAAITLFPQLRQVFDLPQAVYFDVTIVVIGFITWGKYLEMNSKLKTGQALEKLIGLQAKTALVKANGAERELPIEQVKIGDLVVVKPGGKIPLDGRVAEGRSFVDESLVTGESMPVEKKAGNEVVGGSINKQGSFVFEVTKGPEETLLAQIISMVQEAQGSRAPIQNLADRISAVFVPVVLVIAVVSLIAWLVIGPRFLPGTSAMSFGILSFVSVLVIACPCALGLATPTAIIVGVGKGAQHGVLIKDAAALEKLRQVDTLVVDKTGTLTEGKPVVADILKFSTQKSVEDVLQIAASLEAKSEHPLAEAILIKAKSSQITLLPAENFENMEGKGIGGTINGKKYFAGSAKLAQEFKLAYDHAQLEKLTRQGKTPVMVMSLHEVLGILAIADTLKPGAAEIIRELRALGVEAVMMSGDDQRTAEYIANETGITQVYGRLLPQDKAEKIKELQAQGRTVAMAGDGINDAPALARADVGIAMATGTDVAIESADITLLHGDLSKLLTAVRLAHSTVATIKQNLFWAFAYNIVGIPLAAGLFYPLFGWLLNPMFAGAAMALSSVSVVMNSLRLKRAKI